MTHLHTKSENADKLTALIVAVQQLHQAACTSQSHGMTVPRMRAAIESLNHLASEADVSLTELMEQTGVK